MTAITDLKAAKAKQEAAHKTYYEMQNKIRALQAEAEEYRRVNLVNWSNEIQRLEKLAAKEKPLTPAQKEKLIYIRNQIDAGHLFTITEWDVYEFVECAPELQSPQISGFRYYSGMYGSAYLKIVNALIEKGFIAIEKMPGVTRELKRLVLTEKGKGKV